MKCWPSWTKWHHKIRPKHQDLNTSKIIRTIQKSSICQLHRLSRCPIKSDTSNNMDKNTDEIQVKRNTKFRQAFLYQNLSDLALTTQKWLKTYQQSKVAPTTGKKSKLCFIITCQGTHYPSMGQKLYSYSPLFRQHFDTCAKIVKTQYDVDIKQFLEDLSESPDWMNFPRNFLPYLLAVQYGLFKQWEAWGIVPDYVLGLSFGEYGAAAMAGILTLEEAFKLIMTRVELMTKFIKEEAMCVGMMDRKTMEKLLEEAKQEVGEDIKLEIAALNSPLQTCLVGSMKWASYFAEVCTKNGIKNHLVPHHPYHSSLTEPILPEFLKTTSSVKYEKAKCKFISTVDCKLKGTLDSTYFLDHLKNAANFMGGIETALGEGITHFLEIGPHPIQLQMIRDSLDNNDPTWREKDYMFFTSLRRKLDDKVCLLDTLGRLYAIGHDVDWKEVEKVFPA
ncbi:Erythronolide synthase, modules 1 and 2 [Folsomia candida]|uniref:Erythronolide synthase, modules 1 and 2 n=2 Tax=Folsomia candida TaxID=158441 RepID=A0A226DH38_FOLCA|nr:Erythronolide synthase, modules 1 and 2 [Folsomia candida]